MSRLPSVFFLTAICILCAQAAPQTQDEIVLSRQNDDSARTRSERQQALEILTATARRVRGTDPIKSAHLINRAANLLSRLNASKEALTNYRNALAILNRVQHPATRVESLNGIAAVYVQLSRCNEARTYIERALKLSRQNGFVAGEAAALLSLSDCQNVNDHGLAARTAQQSLQLWQSIGDKRGIAQAYGRLSDVQITQHNLIEASRSNEAALNIWRELKTPDEEAGVLIALGFIEYRKGAWQNCLSFLVQAQELIDETDEPYRLGQITAGMAEAFIESGMPESGLAKAKEALGYYRRAEDARGIAAATWDIGKAYYFLGNYSDAVTTLEDARQKAESMNDQLIVAFCHDFLARTYVAAGALNLALSEFKLALARYNKLRNLREFARTLTLIGNVYEQQGRFDLARDAFRSALAQFARLEDQVNESTAIYALGRLELNQSNLELAEGLLRQSLSMTENIRRVSTSSDLATALAPTLHDRYQSYIDCLMRRDRQQKDKSQFAQDAFEASELERGRSLAEMLKATETSLLPALDSRLSEKEKFLRQALRLKEDARIKLLTSSYDKTELDKVNQELTSLEAEYKQVRNEIRSKFPTFDEITQPRSWDLQRIQKEVIADDQTLILEYSLGNERSYAWIITRKGFVSYQLPGEKEINIVAQRVYELLQSNNARNAELEQALQSLAKMILFPLAPQLNQRRLIIIADGCLNYTPFQILPRSPDSHDPLISQFEIVNAPSASVLGQLRLETERRPQHGQLLAAFGDAAFPADFAQRKKSPPDQISSAEMLNSERGRHALRDIEMTDDTFDSSTLQRLVYAQLELKNLREVAGTGSLIATGFEATRQRLQNTDLSTYAILHFATHGVLDPKRPENSGLFLSMVDRDGKSQDGFIGLQDIYNLRAPVDLVVLSACRTGLGKDVRGEGLIGLTRGFMYAGASSVVASLWKVDDEATSELMKQFYTNMLEKEMPPAAALRDAQNFIRKQSQWRSPYYWAAFTLQGEYSKVIIPPQKSRLPFFLGTLICFFLAASGWFYYRRWKFGKTMRAIRR